MPRPRPVPWYLREKEPSAWVKESKIRSSMWAGMPTPVSVTSKRSPTAPSARLGRSQSTCTCTKPASVNLMELPTRLKSTWRTRPGSPTRAGGMSGPPVQPRERFFSRAWGRKMSSTESRTSARLKGTWAISTLPASILDRSRMSLITASRFWPEVEAVSTYLRCRASRGVRWRS